MLAVTVPTPVVKAALDNCHACINCSIMTWSVAACGNRCGTSTARRFHSAWKCSQFVACAEVLALVLCVLQDGHGSDVWLQLLERCATDLDALCSLAQQLAKQGAHHAQQIAHMQEQLSEQRQQYTSMQAGLQRQLQELHAEVQQLRQ
jgi:hypothetical protein